MKKITQFFKDVWNLQHIKRQLTTEKTKNAYHMAHLDALKKMSFSYGNDGVLGATVRKYLRQI